MRMYYVEHFIQRIKIYFNKFYTSKKNNFCLFIENNPYKKYQSIFYWIGLKILHYHVN